MDKYIVVVDPLPWGGDQIAPTLAARGYRTIVVRSFGELDRPAFHDSGDIAAEYPYTPELADELRRYRPIAVIPDSEPGVESADALTQALTPERANDPALAAARRNKGLMYEAVRAAGVPTLASFHAADPAEVVAWVKENDLTGSRLVVKPTKSAGADGLSFLSPGDDLEAPFARLIGTTNNIGVRNDHLVVQELAEGVEYGIQTVSENGVHTLCSILRYTTGVINGYDAMKDYIEWVPFDRDELGELVSYTYDVLDAVGIRWGAAHTEVMLTPKGPRLIETNARRCGPPQQRLCRIATGSSQYDRLTELYVDGSIRTGEFELLQHTMVVYLNAPRSGVVRNVEVLDELATLDTHRFTLVPHGNGDRVVKTFDYKSVLGTVALAGEKDAVFADYHRLREIEATLSIE